MKKEATLMAANLERLKAGKNLSPPGITFRLARAPGTSRLFLGGGDGTVSEVDLAQAKPQLKELGRHTSYVTGLVLAGKQLVSGSYDGRLIWWDTQTRKQVRAVEAHSRWIRNLAVSPDGKTVASVADDMVCRVWEAASGKRLQELRGHKEKTPHHFPSMLFACTYSPDGRLLATADKVGHIVLWETATGKQAATLESPGMYTWDPVQRRHSIGGIRTVAFSPDGKQLAVGGIGTIGNIDHLDGPARVEVFDWQTGKSTWVLNSKVKGLVEQLRYPPSGNWLLAAGGANDGFLLFLDVSAKKSLRDEKAQMHVHDACFSEGGETLYLAGHGRVMTFTFGG
jgi:WD40 repeat protein